MKKLFLIMAVLILAGCAELDFKLLELETANIDGYEINIDDFINQENFFSGSDTNFNILSFDKAVYKINPGQKIFEEYQKIEEADPSGGKRIIRFELMTNTGLGSEVDFKTFNHEKNNKLFSSQRSMYTTSLVTLIEDENPFFIEVEIINSIETEYTFYASVYIR